MKLVECVPNFSEGRDKSILDAIAQQIKTVKNVTLLDVDPGADTNRTVFTMVGEPQAVVEAAFQAIKKAAELIDMSKHKGAHARMGATDVCPFIPVSEMSMDECVELSKQLGKRVGDELGIPVYLYEYSASKPERSNLAVIREGEYEALPEKMTKAEWKPDFGPQKFNSKSGATVIGAREFLIAYNINLNTRDKKKATDIANIIREKGTLKRDEKGKIVKDKDGNKVYEPGLFNNCKAVGWYIDEYNRAQISMNLTNYNITPAHIVLDKVRELATERGVVVTGSELVGLIPLDAIISSGKYYLNKLGESAGLPDRRIIETAIQSMGLAELSEFDIDKKVIEFAIKSENRLADMTLEGFCDELSTDSPAPGGGSVAALCASMSASLSAMVSNLTINKKGYEQAWDKAKEIAEKAQKVKNNSIHAIDEDTQAFYDMMDAMRLPKKTDEEIAYRNQQIELTTKNAILVPYKTIELAKECVLLSEQISKIGNSNALSDAGVGALTAQTAALAAYLNVKINLSGLADEAFKKEILSKALKLKNEVEEIAKSVFEYVDNSVL
ncbi:MAG: glutamate formimidoyltransferase [Candidatus Cloacimonetes bacterium]|nr:glutamate formimidoyltransferase [Candidatus Cloacimonadota bacterium]